MRISEIFHLVFLNIMENKFKVVLTSIGIIVGAATIVLVIAVGRGGQMDVEDQFKNLNAASIEISTTSSNSSSRNAMFFSGAMPGGGNRAGGAMPSGMPPGGIMGGAFQPNLQTVNATLTQEDAEDIDLFIPDVKNVTISANGKKDVLGGNLEEASQYTIAGVKPQYAEISNLELYVGEFITEQDEEAKSKVCVIGYKLATELFDSPIEAFDSIITINDTSFVINGVLKQMGTVSSGISPDEAIYTPYSTGAKYLFGRELNPQITVVANSVSDVPEVIENLKILLDENYPGASFTISDAGSKMQAAAKSSETLSMLLLSVAVIVFFVGGIGIMNVLFVSIKERTKEIGVLKALGMSRRDVLFEFLLEATMISVFGGICGVAAGFGIIPLAESFGTRMEPVLSGYAMAFAFAVATGSVFGFYPALKASRLVPVQALNQE